MSSRDTELEGQPTAPVVERQKLVRCSTVGSDGQRGVRYIALEMFSLWEPMMRDRHQLECSDYSVGLWISADEFNNAPRLFEHSGEIEEVDRFDFTLFDEVNHYNYTASRYVPRSDAERFSQVMLAHLGREMPRSDQFEMRVVPGYCIGKKAVSDRNQLVLGLYHQLHEVH